MKYAESDSVEAGLRFKSAGGLTVETTGKTTHIESHDMYVHEVKIIEGSSEGQIFLHNLDYAEALS